MKALITLVFAFGLMAVCAQRNSWLPDIIPIKKGIMWGYADSAKKIIIPCKYDMAYPFYRKDYAGEWRSSDKGIVKKGKSFFLIDKKGNLTEESSSLTALIEADIIENKIVDGEEAKNGNEQKTKFNFAGNDYENVEEDKLYKVLKNGQKFGVFSNTQKKLIVPVEFEEVKVKKDALTNIVIVLVRKINKWGVYQSMNKNVAPVYDEIKYVEQTMRDKNSCLFICKKDNKYTFLGSWGELLGWGEFDDVSVNGEVNYYYASGFPVKKNGKWGVIDNNTGEPFIPFEYDDINSTYMAAHLFLVKKGKESGYIDSRGNKYF